MHSSSHFLLLSSSRTPGTEFLWHAQHYLGDFMDGRIRHAFFIPYAAIRLDYDEYAERVRKIFGKLGCRITSAHETSEPLSALSECDAIVVGGGNTFKLLHDLHDRNLVRPLREHIKTTGAGYIGWSAGSNLACPSIRTTNDMPVVWPAHYEALGLVQFQINPHYTDSQLPDQPGETREKRLTEFARLNPDIPVVALREGSALQISNGEIHLLGDQPARIFHDKHNWTVTSESRLEEFLKSGFS